MLVNAKTQREVAKAVSNAKAEEKYKKTVELCDRAIPMVRERFEEGIAEKAMNGGRCFRCLLGVEGGQYSSAGILAEVLDEIEYGDGRHGIWHCWGSATRGRGYGRGEEYIRTSWNAMCLSLIDDLKANGYKVEVEKKSHPYSIEHQRECTDLLPEILANHFIQVTW